MEWLNLHTSTIDSPEATMCDPVRRATWIWLLRFCIGQENGGRIVGCGAWGDTTWQQMAKVRLREVKSVSSLWHWDGGDLIVRFYPADKEAEVQAKREVAATNGRRGGRPRKTNVGSETKTDEKPTLVISAKAEGNGMEWNGSGSELRAPTREAQEPPRPPDRDPLEDFTPGPPAREVRRLTLGDLVACHPVVLCHRPEDQDRARTMLALYGWEAMSSTIRALEPAAKKRDHGKRRVLLSELAAALDEKFQLEPDDYRRAGLPVPQETTA